MPETGGYRGSIDATDRQLATSGWLIPGIGGCVWSIDPTHRLVMIVNSVVLKALVGRRMADVGATKDEGRAWKLVPRTILAGVDPFLRARRARREKT